MRKKIGIYCIQNKLNNKQYIGSSADISKRLKEHFRKLRKKEHHSYHLQSAFNKYGEDNFITFIIEEIDIVIIESNIEYVKNKLLEREQYWIDNLKPEYNVSPTASSSLGVKRREETIEKIRKANLGLKHPEWRNKIKSIAQGGENHWAYGKTFSENSKIKMSESHKKLFKNGYIHPNSKPLYQYDFNGKLINEFETISLLRELGFSIPAVQRALLNKSHSSGGFIWIYKDNFSEELLKEKIINVNERTKKHKNQYTK